MIKKIIWRYQNTGYTIFLTFYWLFVNFLSCVPIPQHGLWGQPRPQWPLVVMWALAIDTTLTAREPRTQTLPSVAAWVRMSLRPQQATQISLAPSVSSTPQISTWSQTVAQNTGIWRDCGSNTGHRHQHGLRWLRKLFISPCPSLQYLSPVLSLSTVPEPLSFAFSSISPSCPPPSFLFLYHLFAHDSGTCCGVQVGAWVSFFQSPQASGLGQLNSSTFK